MEHGTTATQHAPSTVLVANGRVQSVYPYGLEREAHADAPRYATLLDTTVAEYLVDSDELPQAVEVGAEVDPEALLWLRIGLYFPQVRGFAVVR